MSGSKNTLCFSHNRTLKTAYRIDINAIRSIATDVGNEVSRRSYISKACVIQVSFCLSEIK